MPGANVHPAEFTRVNERFEAARQAFDALEEAHRRHDYHGPEHDALDDAVNELRAAIDEYRRMLKDRIQSP